MQKEDFKNLLVLQEIEILTSDIYNEFNSCKRFLDLGVCFSRKEIRLKNDIKKLREKIRRFHGSSTSYDQLFQKCFVIAGESVLKERERALLLAKFYVQKV